MGKRISQRIKNTSLGMIAWAFCFGSFGQATAPEIVWKELISVETDTALSIKEKLPVVLSMKKKFEERKLPEDSVYARILHRIGQFEFLLNNNVATNNALYFTHAAVRINGCGLSEKAPAFCGNSYNNLAIYYKSLRMYTLSARYYDSALMVRKRFYIPQFTEEKLLLSKAEVLQATGDYQKAVEELTIAIPVAKAAKDSLLLQGLFNQRAQSYLMQGRLAEALNDVNLAIGFSKMPGTDPETINCIKTKARVLAGQKNFSPALALFDKAINLRLRTTDNKAIANDYTDLGNFYLEDLHNYHKAKDCYFNTIYYAGKVQDREILSKAHSNLLYCSIKLSDHKAAEQYCMEALKNLNITSSAHIFINPTAREVSSVGNKELIFRILENKTDLLLSRFVHTGDRNYLTACLGTALLTDTLLTQIRQEQTAEQSKLHWRNWTREFFTHALEACFLAGDTPLAFFFMEKSRAVLLNDKLNELGAAAYLPQAEAVMERQFQISVLTEQAKMGSLNNSEAGYDEQLAMVSQTKAGLERYIKSLEKKYTAYYQYKYADEVPSLNDLQKRLLENNQTFVHYFMNDTVGYILGITPSVTKMLKLSKKDFKAGMFSDFLQLCSYEQDLKSRYLSFVSSAHSLYQFLFQPLHIPKGRVVICPDNFLVPFEAFCTDSSGSHFLVNDYVFSYVYSARSLLKKYNTYPARAGFIGFAPVTFASYPGLADLKQSGTELKKSARHYHDAKLLTKDDATRHNFFNDVSRYTIINIFSHAGADTSEKEPVLYLYDSLIYLSELQLLRNPAAKLAVLSACQTSVGKNAKGEGIFSLARGFASAGIPSVAATLWKADEQTIYAITEKFHAYLSQGMPKDSALQKAKLFFIQNSDKNNPHPYYWANMILVGKEEAIELSQGDSSRWWVAVVIIITAVFLLVVLFFKKRRAKV